LALCVELLEPLRQLDKHSLANFPGLALVSARQYQEEFVEPEAVDIVEAGKRLRFAAPHRMRQCPDSRGPFSLFARFHFRPRGDIPGKCETKARRTKVHCGIALMARKHAAYFSFDGFISMRSGTLGRYASTTDCTIST